MPGSSAADRLPVTESAPLLPGELHLLFIGQEEPSWTLLTLQLDRAGCSQPRFHWSQNLAEAARLTRQERWDCLIVDDATGTASDDSAAPGLLAQLAALRTGGCLDPVLVLSDRIDDDWLAGIADADCELLVTRAGWRSGALIPWIRCAMRQRMLSLERLEDHAEDQQRRRRESNESRDLLEQRRELAARLRHRADVPADRQPSVPPELYQFYTGLLRAAVMMGPEMLGEEVARFAARTSRAGLTAADLMELHVSAVESLLQGLGNRSSRHVLHRTEAIVLEVLADLADASRGLSSMRAIRDLGIDLLSPDLPPQQPAESR